MLMHSVAHTTPAAASIISEPPFGSPDYMLMLAATIEKTLSADPDGDGMHMGPTDLKAAIAALRIAADVIERARQAGEPDLVLA